MAVEKIGVITSGGDSPGMNTALRAVVRTASQRGIQVLGFRHAYQGIIDGDFIEMSPRDVAGLSSRGGTILKSARCKEWRTPEGRARGAEKLRDNGIDGLIVIGGDGSFTGAHLLETEHDIPCIGVPGTIDNDLYGTDYTIGFITAVNTAVECVDKLRDTAESHDRLFLIEVMGRHSGSIAAIVGLACGAEEVLVPEEKTDIERVRNVLVHARKRGKRSCIVIVSEGDDEGGVFDIKEKLKLEGVFDIRVSVIGHIQRGGIPTAFDRILASVLGYAAVDRLAQGKRDIMVGMRNQEVVEVPLEDTFTRKDPFNEKLLEVTRILAT